MITRHYYILLIAIVACFCFCSEKRHSPSKESFADVPQSIDSLSVVKLLSVAKQSYIGGSVGNLISDTMFNNYIDFVFVDQKPGELSSVLFKYPDDVFVEIIIDNYKYLNRHNEQRMWNFELLKKENVGRINIFKKDTLLKVIE